MKAISFWWVAKLLKVWVTFLSNAQARHRFSGKSPPLHEEPARIPSLIPLNKPVNPLRPLHKESPLYTHPPATYLITDQKGVISFCPKESLPSKLSKIFAGT